MPAAPDLDPTAPGDDRPDVPTPQVEEGVAMGKVADRSDAERGRREAEQQAHAPTDHDEAPGSTP
jgi:hypothetical protein